MTWAHLTHWGRVTHICVGNLTIIGSDNGLSPGRRQAITWTNVGILLIRPLGTNFSEILIGIQHFHSRKGIWKCRLRNGVHLSRPQCVKRFGVWWQGVGSRSFPIIIEFATKIYVIKFDPGTNTHHLYLVKHPADGWHPITCVLIRKYIALDSVFNEHPISCVWFHSQCAPYNACKWHDTLSDKKLALPESARGKHMQGTRDHACSRLPKRYTALSHTKPW